MLFTSFHFILFITILFLLYYLIPKKFQWMLLLLASYLFYSFAGIQYLAYILLTTISTYLVSRQINRLQERQSDYIKENKESLTREERKAYKASIKKKQKGWLVLCLLLNFGILAVLKYADFVIANINSLLGIFQEGAGLPFFRFALPLGISPHYLSDYGLHH